MKDRLWFFGSYRNLDTQTAHGRHRRQRERRQRGALGLGRRADINARLVQDRQMIIGRLTGQLGKKPRSRQLRVPAPLRGHAADGRDRRAATTAATTGSASATTRRPRRCRRKRRPPRRAATSTCRSTSTRSPGRCRSATSCCSRPAITPFRYKPIFGHPPPDGITNLIPVTEQSNAINPATGLPLRAVADLPLPRCRSPGGRRSARPTTRAGDRCPT